MTGTVLGGGGLGGLIAAKDGADGRGCEVCGGGGARLRCGGSGAGELRKTITGIGRTITTRLLGDEHRVTPL